MGVTTQSTAHPFNSTLSNLRQKKVMGDHVKTFTDVQSSDICSSSLVHWCGHSSIDEHWVGQARHPCCSCAGCPKSCYPSTFSTAPRKIHSMSLPDTEVRLTGCTSQGHPFHTSERGVQCFPFSSHLELHLTAMISQISWRMACQLHQPIPLRTLGCTSLGPTDLCIKEH